MRVTNQTPQDYYFGPLHLAAGSGSFIDVDDTSATSLYLTDDTVADAINTLSASGKVVVSNISTGVLFPRPTGQPEVLHGDGSPEGIVYAGQGSIYLRRDNSGGAQLYQKSTGIHLNIGWVALAGAVVTTPTGAVQTYAAATAPTGWLICDGSAVSRATYADLFGVISTTFGSGDGSTTFNVPDLRGRVPVGYAPSGGHVDVSSLGGNDGVTLANRRPKHRHTPHSHTHDATAGGGQNGQLGRVVTSGDGSSGTATTADAKDGGSGNTNDPLDAPAYLILNHIIKT
jgi:microcystin-dependent protein